MPIDNVGWLSLIPKILAFILKLFFAILGAGVALIFSGDIGQDGRLNLNKNVALKLTFSVFLSITGTPNALRYLELQEITETEKGLFYILIATFGLLIVGICYRAMEMLKGKTFSEICIEIKQAFFAIQLANKHVDYSNPKYDRRSQNRKNKE